MKSKIRILLSTAITTISVLAGLAHTYRASAEPSEPLVPTQPGVNIRRISWEQSGVETSHNSHPVALSRDGNRLAFHTQHPITADDVDGGSNDVFIRDLRTGEMSLVTTAPTSGDFTHYDQVFFSDGWGQVTYAVFEPGNNYSTYHKDLRTGVIQKVNVPNANSGITAQDCSSPTSISADGNVVGFTNCAALTHGNANTAYIRKILQQQTFVAVPYDTMVPGYWIGNAPPAPLWLSENGENLFYNNTVFNCCASSTIVARYNVVTGIAYSATSYGTLSFLSASSDASVIVFSGFVVNTCNLYHTARLPDGSYDNPIKFAGIVECYHPRTINAPVKISGDGKWIVYESAHSNSVENDTNNKKDIFLYEVATGKTQLISVNSQGIQGNFDSSNPQISGDGSKIVFESSSTTFDYNDTNASSDMFLVDMSLAPEVTATPVPTPAPSPTPLPINRKPYQVVNFFGFQGFYGPQMQCQGVTQYSSTDPTIANYPDVSGMAKWVAELGYNVWLGSYKTGPYETGGVAANVTGPACVADQMARVKAKLLPGQEIWILCHSMGCMEAQWYLHYVPGGTDRVRGITMMGAPNMGIPHNTPSICNAIATVLKPFTLASGNPCDLNKQVAFREVLEGNVGSFAFACAPGVEYTVIGGSSLSPFALVSKFAFAGAQAPLYATDGLIATHSTLGLTCADHKFLTSEAHISRCHVATNGYTNSCAILQDREAYHIFKDVLSGDFSATTLAAEQRANSASVLLPYVPGNRGYNSLVYTGTSNKPSAAKVAAGEQLLSADVSDGTAIFVVEGMDDERSLRLVRPDGTQVDLGVPTAEISVTQTSAATVIFITNGMSGVWQLQISPSASLGYDLQASAFFSPSAQLTVSLPATATVGQSLRVGAELVGGTAKNATYKIQITAPDGSGGFASGQTASFVLNAQGVYVVEVTASYIDGSGNLAQQKKLVNITVSPSVVVPPVATVTSTPRPSATPQSTVTSLPTSETSTPEPSPTMPAVTATSQPTSTPGDATATATVEPSPTATSTPTPRTFVTWLPMTVR